MSPGERLAYAECLDHVRALACKLQTLLSNCRDCDGRIVSDETRLRSDIGAELKLLARLAPAILILSKSP